MIKLWDLNTYIDNLLDTKAYPDASVNGLQVESRNLDIKTVAFAVDSGLSTIQAAAELNADLLIVHHGLFWSEASAPITGLLAKKIDLLLESKCSLIAQHLPLDGDPVYGNNYQLAGLFGLEDLKGYYPHGENKFIGCKGTLSSPVKIEYFLEKAEALSGFDFKLSLPFGKPEIKSCSIISGSGAFAIADSAKLTDLFISGEPKQEAYHEAKDHKQNALFLGHYATETVGLQALSRHLEKEFNLKTHFIVQPTGI